VQIFVLIYKEVELKAAGLYNNSVHAKSSIMRH